MKNQWYSVKAAFPGKPAIINIFGPIVDYKWSDDEVTAKEFVDHLKNLQDVEMHINSPGGSVWAANVIYNAMRRHEGAITVYIDGLAASAASLIAMGGDRVIMPENAMMMIHDPRSVAIGTAEDFRKIADMLDKAKAGLIAAYRDKSGKTDAEVSKLMANETWMTAEEAVELGFADEMEDPVKLAAAGFDLSLYHNVPADLKEAQRTAPAAALKPQKNLSTIAAEVYGA